MVSSRIASVVYTAALLGLALAHSHGHDDDNNMDMGDMDMDMASPPAPVTSEAAQIEPSYFRYGEYQLWIYGHIATMVIAWCFALPVATMFSVAKSRYTLPAQVVFLALHVLGVVQAITYRANVPDLYEHNVHYRMGWVFSWFALAWVVLGIVNIYARRRGSSDCRRSGEPISVANMAQYARLQTEEPQQYRWSGDSGQGTERNTMSLAGSRSNSYSASPGNELADHPFEDVPVLPPAYQADDDEAEAADGEKRGFLRNTPIDRFLSKNVHKYAFGKTLSVLKWTYIFFERTMVIYGFFAISSGGVVFGGVMRGHDIFNGLAHFIKGGIFFWYGLLTLGRWMGAFADFGWAWNIKPPKSMVGAFRAWVPSGEFTESFVIFLYGITNVWLEHLGGWGGEWGAQDLEHISITFLFAGGGLLGMLIESTRIRELLYTNILITKENDDHAPAPSPSSSWEKPNHYSVPLNPMPGLVIMLLGLMMSSHHQASMVSSMLHKNWGMLFVGFALSRAATYILFYLKPPTSYLPSRPPTEIVTSFCLCAGGLMFMSSTSTLVDVLEYNELDAMFVFTVVMGLTGGIMAWVCGLMALLGWAVRKENSATFRRLQRRAESHSTA